MEKKTGFDPNSAFKSIIGVEQPTQTPTEKIPSKKKPEVTDSEKENRVYRAYWLDKDISKALKMKAMDEETTLTQAINDILRKGLSQYKSIDI